MSGFTLGFLFGLKLSVQSGLAIYLCLGLSTTTVIVTEFFPGLGIDDMFALVATLENLTEEEMLLPLDERIGLVSGNTGSGWSCDN